MDCFNDKIIQEFIDAESTDSLKAAMENHLQNCVACQTKVILAKKRKEEITSALNDFAVVPPEVPAFKVPEKSTLGKGRSIVYFSYAAAVLLILFAIQQFYNPAKVMPEQNMVYQQLDIAVDANKPITEQEFVMHIVDPDGNVTEYYY